jgi:ubiquinol-cytochrome c reductase iron-sulfur subunit
MTVVAALWLVLAIVCAVVFAAGFALNANAQIEGGSLGLACLSIACALIVWSRHLIPHVTVEDEQHSKRSRDEDRETVINDIGGGLAQVSARKSWLVRLGFAAASVLGIAALFPIRTFGPNPQGRIGKSDWKPGDRLVGDDGAPLRADMLEVGTVATAFPEGYVGAGHVDSMANDAIVVVRVTPQELQLPPDRANWAPDGLLAYSKICTHLGCPLGLYRQGDQQLMCPCHQSIFNVLDGGSVVFGPAARALPQLPLTIDPDGTLRAGGGMSDFVGPDNWNYNA